MTVAAGVATALSGHPKTLKACATHSGTLRLLTAKGKCPHGTSKTSFDVRGPKGAKGATGPSGTKTFTTSGTYKVPAGVTTLLVKMWGGGGAGGTNVDLGGSFFEGGGGGGQGAFVDAVVPVTPGQTIPVTVGTGGATTSGSGTDGTASAMAGLEAHGGTGGVQPPASDSCGDLPGSLGGVHSFIGGEVLNSVDGTSGGTGVCGGSNGFGGSGGGSGVTLSTGVPLPGAGGSGKGGESVYGPGTSGLVVVTAVPLA